MIAENVRTQANAASGANVIAGGSVEIAKTMGTAKVNKSCDGKEAQGVEKSQEQDQLVEVFENDIMLYLSLFCDEQGIEDMRKAPQAVWNAAMMYIRRNVFSDNRVLKRTTPLNGYKNNDYVNQYSNINNSNCNAYDIDKINRICDYYIYICNMYDKGVTISGFSKLTGIDESTIFEWGEKEGESRKLSKSSVGVYKKLHAEYENSLEAKLWSNRNPVAHMAIANKRFGWNMPGVRQEKKIAPAETPEQIAARYGQLAIEERQGLPEPPE